MIGKLKSNEADFGISSIANVAFRRVAVNYNIQTFRMKVAAYFRSPDTNSQITALLRPFQLSLWISIIIWILATGFFMRLLTHVSQYYEQIIAAGYRDNFYFNYPSPIRYKWNYWDCVVWPVRSLCLQGFKDENEPGLFCVRFLILFNFLIGYIIYSAFSGVLISFLSVNVDPIQNFRQLLSAPFIFSIIDDPIALKHFAVRKNMQ